jgi:hypothetical protein
LDSLKIGVFVKEDHEYRPIVIESIVSDCAVKFTNERDFSIFTKNNI